jgi:hypothetical protein
MFKVKDGLRVGATDVIDSSGTLLTLAANAALLNGRNESFLRNASNLNAGTIPTARLPSTVAFTGANTLTGLQTISISGATTDQEYLQIRPTDFGPGNPYLFIKKGSQSNRYEIGLNDDEGNTGVINFDVTGDLLHNGQKIWTAINDGSGSGLDADMLDGFNSSYFTSASNLNTGTLPIARLPSFSGGDITSNVGTAVLTLATVNGNVGSFGSTSAVPIITVNGKGLITAVSTGTITPAAIGAQTSNANLTAYAGANWTAGTQIPTLTAANTIALRTVGQAATNILDKAAGDALYLAIAATAASATQLATGRTIGITGDLTWTSPAFNGTGNVTAAGTLATVNSNVGTYGSTTAVPIITVNAKGLITAVSTATLGSAATRNTGTSGATIPLLDGVNTWSGNQTYSADVTVNGNLSVMGTTFTVNATNIEVADAIITVAKNNTGAIPHSGIKIERGAADAFFVWDESTDRFVVGTSSDDLGTSPTKVPMEALSYVSTVTTGTAPLTVSSTTVVSNLNADLLDGQHGTYYLDAANLTGTISAARSWAQTGDVTSAAGSAATTLATVNANVGTHGSGTAIPTFTVNAKGLITAASTTTLTAANVAFVPSGNIAASNVSTALAELDAEKLSVYNNAIQTNGVANPSWFTSSPSNQIGVSSNSTGSTGHPTEFGVTWSFKASNLAADANYTRAFDLYKWKGSAEWSLRDYDTNGVERSWNKIWHSGNVGASSGLDADLLDGQHGSFYQNASNLSSGTLLAARMPALTGDVTSSAGSVALTLATVNSNVGSFGSVSAVPVITVNAKGLVTAVSTAALGTAATRNTGTSGTAVPLLDGNNTFSGTSTFSGAFTVTSSNASFGTTNANATNIINIANPGIGYTSGFNISKTSDSAGIYVTETSTDLTLYEMWMSDNPDSGDAFQWRFTDYQGLGGLWTPIRSSNLINQLVAKENRFWGKITQSSPLGFYTTGDYLATGVLQNVQVFNNTSRLPRQALSGTITITSLDVSGYTGPDGNVMWIKAASATTFDWGYGPVTTATVTGVSFSTSAVTLSNGVRVAFSATTGAVSGDTWQWRSFKPISNTFGPSSFEGQITSTVADGTAPLVVSSQTVVTGLNADLLDGQDGSFYQDAANINSGTLAVSRGGTGLSSFTANAFIRASNATTLEQRTPDQVLQDINGTRTIVSATAPTSPVPGTRWIDTNSGNEYVYYTDNNSSQWVQFGSPGTQMTPMFVQDTAPVTTGAYLWIQTNYEGDGDFTIWFDDGK